MTRTANNPITAEIVEAAYNLGNTNGDAHLVLDNDVIKILAPLEHQLTKAQQDIRDETHLADWQRFRLLRDVRVGAQIYVALNRARGQGRKTIRIDDLLKEATR
ncbi:DUF7463 family protein [Rhodococcus sp. OK302]|uniref:DUF7463 family protein n=1 Tax=Rhodococcus sp. OK302 TaxID=1882769 RepID=UPI000B94152C|nr:hypothetical protein [Rhodococcus sp. OK302]OYD61353.1 hypothetical protein BDB13_6326 [Rhodococcus sp. OK302]